MESTSARKTSKKGAAIPPESRIQLAYVDYILMNGQRPPSVFKFTHDIGIKESGFYDHFGSFEGVERSVWKDFFERTLQRLLGDNAYSAFSIREKLLAFYYTLFEELKLNRSFAVFQLNQRPKAELVPGFLKDFKGAFDSYIGNLLTEGKASGEIANRPYMDKTYPRLFWVQLGFLLMFWKDDQSPAFQQTDAAVEKSVNLAFDLIGKGAVDTAFDFAKFLFQTRVK